MKARFTVVLAILCLTPAMAQTPSPPNQPAPSGSTAPSATPAPAPVAPAPSPDRPSGTRVTDEDRLKDFPENQIADQIDARIAQMKASLRLSEEQNAHWPEFQMAARRLGVADAKRRYIWSERMGLNDRRDGRPQDSVDEIELLRAEADDMAARATDFRQLADAMAPLYRSLDERQQQRLLRFVHRAIDAR